MRDDGGSVLVPPFQTPLTGGFVPPVAKIPILEAGRGTVPGTVPYVVVLQASLIEFMLDCGLKVSGYRFSKTCNDVVAGFVP